MNLINRFIDRILDDSPRTERPCPPHGWRARPNTPNEPPVTTLSRAERWLAEYGRFVRFDEDDITVSAARERAYAELKAILDEREK